MKRYAKLANLIFEPLTKNHSQKFSQTIAKAGFNTLSTTYLSISYLTAFIIFTISILISVFTLYQFTIWYPFLISIAITFLTIIIFKIYPKRKANLRKKILDAEIPFISFLLLNLTKAGLKGKNLFKPLLHYKEIKIEALRIINFINFKNLTLNQALTETAKLTPSKKLEIFLTQMSTTSNLKQFLTQNIKFKKKTQFYRETGNIFHNLKLKFIHYLFILIAITLIATIYFYDQTYLTLAIPTAIIIAWLPVLISIRKKFKTDRKMENQFVKFVKDLEKIQITNLNKGYGPLTEPVQKLINQYKMGIETPQLLKTFANKTNQTIKEIINISLQTEQPLKNLHLITQAIIQKNKLRFEK